MIYRPNSDSFECYVDANWIEDWDPEEAREDTDTAQSRSGYLPVVSYAGCPLLWSSRLQPQIALSTTESEYITLSTALREVIPLIEIVKELKQARFEFQETVPKMHCKV
jgi:hypothetical protein